MIFYLHSLISKQSSSFLGKGHFVSPRHSIKQRDWVHSTTFESSFTFLCTNPEATHVAQSNRFVFELQMFCLVFVFLFVFFVCYLCATISDEIVGEVFCERHKLASITSLLSEKHHHRHQHHTSKRRRTITTLLSAEHHHCHHIWITSFSIYIVQIMQAHHS